MRVVPVTRITPVTHASRGARGARSAKGERSPKGERTRSQIIAAASAAFERDGFGGAGLSAILGASGAPRGSLYFHFPRGKEELAVAAIESALEQLQPIIEGALQGP